MAFEHFDGWGNLFAMFFFFAVGGVLMWLARPSAAAPEGWKKTYKGFAIFSFVIGGINTIFVIGKAYYASQIPGQAPPVMDAVLPTNGNGNGKNPIIRNDSSNGNGKNPIFRNDTVYYNAPLPIPTRKELLQMEAIPKTRANLIRQQAAKIPNTPVA